MNFGEWVLCLICFLWVFGDSILAGLSKVMALFDRRKMDKQDAERANVKPIEPVAASRCDSCDELIRHAARHCHRCGRETLASRLKAAMPEMPEERLYQMNGRENISNVHEIRGDTVRVIKTYRFA